MKKLLFAILSMVGLLAFTSCGDPNETGKDPQQPGQVVENVQLSSSSVAEGAEVTAKNVSAITLNYMIPVRLSSHPQITLNGNALSARKVAGSTSSIEIPVSLEPGTEYNLIVASGTVIAIADSMRTAPKLDLHFTTRSEGDDGLPKSEAMDLTRRLGFGWNLGNHFDTQYSTDFQDANWYWDGAHPTKALYQKLVAAGVQTVRMCATWGNHQDNDGNYTVRTSFMEEVAQNVAWAHEVGLIVILNTHHDEYWQDVKGASTNPSINDEVKDRIEKTWQQIANRFKDEGDYLIFETFNEVHDTKGNDWTGKDSYYKIINEWNQLAVNTIRATGSVNATRYIAVPGYAANPGITMRSLTLPQDPAGKIIVAVHCYDPYNFTLANPLSDNLSQSDLNAVKNLLNQLKTKYIDNNIPCYMGEFGCSRHNSDAANQLRKYYLEYFCRAAHFAGIAPMLWDNYNPGGGSEHHAYFDHNNGDFLDDGAELIPMMVNATINPDTDYTVESIQK